MITGTRCFGKVQGKYIEKIYDCRKCEVYLNNMGKNKRWGVKGMAMEDKMMRKLKIYLDTSVINFLFADDAPEKRDITKALFEEISQGKYEVYISELVIAEIFNTEDEEKKRKLLDIIQTYQPKELSGSEEVFHLTEKYLKAKIVPKRFEEDAIHIAYAVINDIDVLISWNMRHIVRLKTRWGVNSINKIEGYKEIELISPEEVIEDED
ncbi:PIN domain-containing protein [bacterium]|nr:PIN domain-containing protein [bacterium]